MEIGIPWNPLRPTTSTVLTSFLHMIVFSGGETSQTPGAGDGAELLGCLFGMEGVVGEQLGGRGKLGIGEIGIGDDESAGMLGNKTTSKHNGFAYAAMRLVMPVISTRLTVSKTVPAIARETSRGLQRNG